MNISKIKTKAAKKLKGNYGVIVPALLIYALITGIFYTTAQAVWDY